MTDLISQRLEEYDIDIYRQDFNMPAWNSWQRNASGPDGSEEPDRVGLNEMKHVAGLYDFLDGLVARRPHLLIDNCAGGGRRMDLEMLKRSVTFCESLNFALQFCPNFSRPLKLCHVQGGQTPGRVKA